MNKNSPPPDWRLSQSRASRGLPRLAIISTFDDLCGIAGYTRFLAKQLEFDFDIEIFDLDQFFMRGTDYRLRRLADKMVKEFCVRLKAFDFVNIQLEHGTLGRHQVDIIRRFRWLAEAAPALSVTMHTVLPHESLDFIAVLKYVAALKISAATRLISTQRSANKMNIAIFGVLRRMAKRKPTNVIVHTRRDQRLMHHIHRLPNVYDHPLAFLSPAVANEYRARSNRDSFPVLKRLPSNAVVIGVFGFLSEYKGFDIVIRAMHLLPDHYHLLIFGGVHPQEIKRNQKLNPYLKTLLDESYVTRSVFDDLEGSAVSLTLDSKDATLLVNHPKNIGSRVHFLGAQSDEDFAKGMAICDDVVLPYVETGQSSSGPMSLALEMGCRVLAARNHAFLQFARYHPQSVEFFDIGNHLELAERILAKPAFALEQRSVEYNSDSNRRLYVKANTAATVRDDADELLKQLGPVSIHRS